MFCINCGKQIPEGAAFCPECGASQRGTKPSSAEGTESRTRSANQSTGQKKPYNTMCILGAVISGMSLFVNFFAFLGLVGIAGTTVSLIGLRSCTKKNEKGKVLAIIGIVLGSSATLKGVLVLWKLLNM